MLPGLPAVTLREYQTASHQAFVDSPLKRKLIVLPTGCGKTVTGIALGKLIDYRKRARAAGPAKVLWLAHREELIFQPVETIRRVWPEATYGIVKADKNEFNRQVVFASIQSASQEKRREQLRRMSFDLVVVDEAHHALADQYVDLLVYLGCFDAEGGPELLGITATPERSDGKDLGEDINGERRKSLLGQAQKLEKEGNRIGSVAARAEADALPILQLFEAIVFNMGIKTAIDLGYLVPPVVTSRPIRVDLDSVSKTRGDFSVAALDIALLNAGIVDEVVAAYEEHAKDCKSIIFTVSVKQAEAIAEKLRALGYPVAAVSGETPLEQRRGTLKRLKTGELRAVVNCMVLTEGFDETSVDCIMLARPTQSKSLMIQMVGRGLRLHPGKEACKVIDLVGVSKRNSMIQAAVLFGPVPIEDLEMRERAERGGGGPTDAANSEEFWRKRLLAQIEGVGGPSRAKLHWLNAEGGGYVLNARQAGTVRMVPAGADAYTVEVMLSATKRQLLAQSPVDIEEAQALAEDFVRRSGQISLFAEGTEAWRSMPATSVQLSKLKKYGVKNTAGLSRGTASDLITVHEAQKNTQPASKKQIAFLRSRGRQVPDTLTMKEARKMMASFFGARR